MAYTYTCMALVGRMHVITSRMTFLSVTHYIHTYRSLIQSLALMRLAIIYKLLSKI